MKQGCVFDIQRFSIHDGPGIRTTVFLKGCPLRCLWCGNPESIAPRPQLSYLLDKCIACGACPKTCPVDALTGGAAGAVTIDWKRCTQCGACPTVCDPKALEMVGHAMTVEEVFDVVLRDCDYYAQSGGGLTLSGGEPLFQSGFAEALLSAAKSQNLHGCVETSGYAPRASFERLIPVVDLWLFDYKETDPVLHRHFTGRELSIILDRLQQLYDTGAKILIRCPMIPGYNARRQHLDGIVALTRRLPKLQGVELLPYYDLWRPKLKRFGLVSSFPESVKPPSAETVRSWNDYLRERGVRVAQASNLLVPGWPEGSPLVRWSLSSPAKQS